MGGMEAVKMAPDYGEEKEIVEPEGGAYIEEEGQIVAGFIGKELKEGWEKKLPETTINGVRTKIRRNMVYIVPQSYGYEWRLQYTYIESKKTLKKFYADEAQWALGQPEEGVYDPRVEKEEKKEPEEKRFSKAA
jgi:hypothetical protein